jgi:hypothetical protein
VLADGRQNRELPLVPTLLCLLGAGWVTSVLTSFLFLGGAYPTGGSPALLVGARIFLSAAVGAVVVRHLLLNFVGRELAYSAILVALVAGSAASTVAQLVFFSPSVMPAAGLGLSLVSSMLGVLVSYWLLQNAARSEAGPPVLAPPEQPQATAPLREQERPADPYSQLVDAARETALGLVAAVGAAQPSAVPCVIGDGLIWLEVARKRLEQTPPPRDVPPELVQRLAAGMAQLGDDLAVTAQGAALTADDRMYQPGLLGPSLADVSDRGGRYRWELDQSRGVRTVREALEELAGLGYGGLAE